MGCNQRLALDRWGHSAKVCWSTANGVLLWYRNGTSWPACAINVAEVYGDMRAPETEKTEALLLSLDYVPISWEASKLAGELRQEWAAFLLPGLPP